jgi:hypothetical protein
MKENSSIKNMKFINNIYKSNKKALLSESDDDSIIEEDNLNRNK